MGTIRLFLVVASGFAGAGSAPALTVFIPVSCVGAWYTEVGLGDAWPYLLQVVVAGSLLAAPSDPLSPATFDDRI